MPKAKLEDVTVIRFRAGTLARIDAVAGKNRRAHWLREVVDAELSKSAEREKAQAPARS